MRTKLRAVGGRWVESAPSIALAVLIGGCSADGCGVTPAAHLPSQSPSSPTEATVSAQYPPVVRDGLPASVPATRLELRADGMHLANAELIASWPADALERAREGASDPDWPTLDIRLPTPSEQTGELPGLRRAFERARQAERSATGAGRGAGTYNLRVAEDVPYRALQRVLFTGAMAGYGPPRVLLGSDSGPRYLAWPPSLPRNAPTPEQIAALVRGQPLPDDPDALPPPERPATVVLRADGTGLVQLAGATQRAGCAEPSDEPDPVTFLADVPPEAIRRCLDALRPRTDENALTLAIDGEVRFGQLSPVLQHAAEVFETVRIRRR